MDLNTIWSAALSLVMAAVWFFIREKFEELSRLNILLNKTREEIARDYAVLSRQNFPQIGHPAWDPQNC